MKLVLLYVALPNCIMGTCTTCIYQSHATHLFGTVVMATFKEEFEKAKRDISATNEEEAERDRELGSMGKGQHLIE